MAKQILQINFNFDGPRDVAVQTFMPLAKPIADQPGLKWKIWCWNDKNREFAGEYLFEDEGALEAYIEGEIVDQVKQHPATSNISAKVFELLENPTAITRGPV
jgi:hypothetical protein